MNRKGQSSIWGIVLILIVVSILLIYLMPLIFVASDIASTGQTGVFGFFTGFLPYFIIFFFIIVGVLWRGYAG